MVAQALTGVSHGTLADGHAIWWFHGLLAITFVASIPYTKATHMLQASSRWRCATSMRGSGWRRSRPSEPSCRGLRRAGRLNRSWHLLQLDACTKCGRCHEACPANATGRPLSPRDVIVELRERQNRALQSEGVGGVLG